MKKAVIYTGTAVPNPASNKKQEELCSQYARNNGYELKRLTFGDKSKAEFVQTDSVFFIRLLKFRMFCGYNINPYYGQR